MITSPKSYSEILNDIKRNPDAGLSSVVKMVNPDTEPIFIIDSNSRTITVPKELETIGVSGDHNAETVYFEIDRYFDAFDLKNLTCIIQYRNALRQEYISICDPNEYIEINEDGVSKIRFGWTVGQTVTAAPGAVDFAVRFFETQDTNANGQFDIEEKELLYSLNTKPAKVFVAQGLNVTDNPEYNPVPEPITETLTAIKKVVDQFSEVQGNIQFSALHDKPVINNVEIEGVDKKPGGYTSAELKLVGQDDFLDNFKANTSIANSELEFQTIEEVLNATNIFQPYLTAENIDKELRAGSTNAIQNQAVYAKFEALKSELGDSVYIPIEILSFDNNIKIKEKGDTVTSVTFNYSFNQVPNSLMLQINENPSEAIATTSNSFTKTNLELKADTIFLLSASDKKNHTETKVSNLKFLNGVYYGAVSSPDIYDSTFILSLNKKLQPDHHGVFNVDAKEDQYIYYCAPSAYGYPLLSVNGLIGGFEKVNVEPVAFTNSFGYTENYDVYKSDYFNLGETLVKVE